MNKAGLLTCLRYSLPPNNLSYCGPEKTKELVSYHSENFVDQGLVELLSQFDTLYHYLSFIAYENNIADPFDPRVVEAYWIGNNLLPNINVRAFHRYLDERLELKRKLPKKTLSLLYGKLDYGITPHHTVHVLTIFRRTGHLPIEHTLETMDACRIGWGKVTKVNKDETLAVLAQPLVLKENRLALEHPREKILTNNILGKRLFVHLAIGDWVSFHWQAVCDKLRESQVNKLKSFTLKAIHLANISL